MTSRRRLSAVAVVLVTGAIGLCWKLRIYGIGAYLSVEFAPEVTSACESLRGLARQRPIRIRPGSAIADPALRTAYGERLALVRLDTLRPVLVQREQLGSTDSVYVTLACPPDHFDVNVTVGLIRDVEGFEVSSIVFSRYYDEEWNRSPIPCARNHR